VLRLASAVQVSDLNLATATAADADMAEATPVPSTSAVPAEVPMAIDDSVPVPAFESSGDPKLDLLIARRLRSSPPIAPSACLFCPVSSASAQDNAVHMRHAHGFTIPEEEYLVDLEGLLRRLGEEVGSWNVCICCAKGYGGNIRLDDEEEENRTDEERRKRASKGVEAVRAHMLAKVSQVLLTGFRLAGRWLLTITLLNLVQFHCRIPYDTESQQLSIADFYDFRPSYPDYAARQARKAARRALRIQDAAGDKVPAEGWEDADDASGSEGDDDIEVVYEIADADSSDSELGEDGDDDDDQSPSSGITYGDSQYELVLASGARIGHRKHAYIARQNLVPYLGQNPFKPTAHSNPDKVFKPSAHSKALLSLVQMPKDKSHSSPLWYKNLQDAALIPAKGAGFNGHGEVIKARNKGEAKHAAKATREVLEHRKFQRFALKRAIKANNQEHFRDPFLQ